ncbi:MAG: phosphate/phosphite/phosphonate ABC transporter substrate-binding protein [Alphaproteobacteria bacterium]
MKFPRIISALALAVLMFVPAAAGAADTYKLAVTDVEGLERLQTEWGPFKAALEKASGVKFNFFPVNNRTAAAEALRAKRVDFVITGPAEYVVINKMTSARPVVGFGRPDYFCAVIVLNKSDILKISDLKGKKVAFSDVGSTSGHLCPMQLMADYGLDPTRDIQAIHVSRNIGHEALKRGDIAALGYNHNTWVERARNKDKSVVPGAFRIIARSGDLPQDLLMGGAHVDSKAVERIKAGILDNQASIRTAILAHDENAKFKGMEFKAVVDSDYDVVRSMYKTIGQPKFATFVGN